MSSISNMVGEVIGTIAYLNALLIGVNNVYFTGRVSAMNSVRNGIEKRLNLAGVTGNYKDNQEYGNAIGAIASKQNKYSQYKKCKLLTISIHMIVTDKSLIITFAIPVFMFLF